MSDPENYAADWVQHSLDAQARHKGKVAHVLTPFQREALDLLVRAFRTGIYNLSVRWDRVDWGRGEYVSLVIYRGGIATYDFDHLTRLVIAAHDACIRVELEARAPGYFRLWMHPRDRDGDAIHKRHPTLEDAVEAYRKQWPVALAERGSGGGA